MRKRKGKGRGRGRGRESEKGINLPSIHFVSILTVKFANPPYSVFQIAFEGTYLP